MFIGLQYRFSFGIDVSMSLQDFPELKLKFSAGSDVPMSA